MNKRVVFITGASRGIGLEIYKKFYSDGYEIIAPSRKEIDLSDINSINNFLDRFDKTVDILINNAGINELAYSYEFENDNLIKVMNVNLFACILISKKIIPSMIKNNYGRIVNISSIWSIVSKPKRYLYSISKSALNAMTRSLAVEVADKNILVNAVAPGFVKTELTFKNNSEEEIKKIESQIPIGRLAEPNEIVNLVYFLASENNSYITGQTIIIDGGYTCL